MRLKRSRKIVSILVTLSFLVAMLVPMTAPAGAATGISCNSPTNIGTDGNRLLGDIYVEVNVNEMTAGDTVNVRLPDDFTLYPDTAAIGSVDTTTVNAQEIQDSTAATVVLFDVPNIDNALHDGTNTADNFTVSIEEDNEFKLTYNGANLTSGEATGYLYIRFQTGMVYVPSGAPDDVKAYFEAPSTSGWPTGEVVVARTTSAEVDVTIDSLKNVTTGDTLGTIRIKEDRGGALEGVGGTSAKTITMKLPRGMEWDVTSVTCTDVTGDWSLAAPAYTVTNKGAVGAWTNDVVGANTIWYGVVTGSERELIISVSDDTATEGILRITPVITIDEDDASFGDITVNFSGETTVAGGSSLVIGSYCDYGLDVYEGTSEEIIAGRDNDEVGDFYIEELGPGSLLTNRSITLTLPSGAKWDVAPTASVDEGDVTLGAPSISTDRDKVTYKVTAMSTKASKINFEDGEASFAVDKKGDINLKISGSAGVEGEVKIATVVPVVTGSIASVNDLRVGVQDQLLGDITLVEGKKEALLDDGQIVLRLPEGFTFAATPDYEVIEGDLEIATDSVKRANNNRDVVFEVKSQSYEPSTIKFSDIKVNALRYVAEGPIEIDVRGNVGTTDYGIYTAANCAAFPNNVKAATIKGARVITPAPGEVKNESEFVIGDASYTVNGEEKTMDVAPYIKSDRTYMPLRFVAYAAGVSDDNIMWNQAEQSVVLIKGDRVVKLVIGSNNLLINGVNFSMDVAPELVDPGRTMLPIRWVAQALGCSVEWDGTTQTVTIN